MRAGKGFSFKDASGAKVTDPDLLERISHLAIPPAWTDVWIAPYANGHIQATGTDAAGRTQYLYHPQWRQQKDRLKFDRALALAESLPAARRRPCPSPGCGRWRRARSRPPSRPEGCRDA